MTLKSIWEGLTFQDGSFSTKRAAYSLSVVVSSYLIVHVPNLDWSLLTCYMLHCTGPGTIREFLAYKTNQGVKNDNTGN